jgi:signal transduction histidine kinase
MDIWRFSFILITEIIRLIITRRFTFSFLYEDENHLKRTVAYSFSAAATTLTYYFANISWMNLLATICGLMVIAFSYGGSIKKKLLFVFYVLGISCVIDITAYVLLSHTFNADNYSELASIFSLLILLVAQLITKRIFGDSKNKDIENKHWWQYISSQVICVLTFLVVIMDASISLFSLFVVCGSFLVFNLLIAHLIDDLIDTTNRTMENLILHDQIIAYERELSLQNEKSEQIRAIRHDIKRHLEEIKHLSKREEESLIREYIDALEEQLIDASPICDSGNPGLDTVLNYMLQKAKDKGIAIHSKIAVPKELKISVMDMNIILGNLIENAIDANERTKNPKIDLAIHYVKDSLIIELSNTYSNVLKFKNGYPVSTKMPVGDHGYGIKNVLKVLSNYENSFDISNTNDMFTVRILMKVS